MEEQLIGKKDLEKRMEGSRMRGLGMNTKDQGILRMLGLWMIIKWCWDEDEGVKAIENERIRDKNAVMLGWRWRCKGNWEWED